MKIKFEELKGKIFNFIKVENAEIIFIDNENNTYSMFHDQNCCEDVYIESITGDTSDLIGVPILLAEEVIYDNEIPKDNVKQPNNYDNSFTWTFYKLATIKGNVTIRWYGGSNGYYSETVNLYKI